MSRLCVKNLPKYVGEDRLRDFFSQKGEVTDAKLMKTKDGKSRQFAFIGFHTEREAEEALKFFNNSYIDTCRIICEVARKVGDPNIPRPWSRYSAKKENVTKENKEELVRGKSDSLPKGLESSNKEGKKSKSIEKNDPKLQEFLQVMQPRAKTKIWADDNHSLAQLDQDGKAGIDEIDFSKSKKKKQAGHVLGQVIDDSNKANNLADKTSSNKLFRGCPETNSVENSNRSAHDDAISDMDYFRSKVKKDFSDSETDDEDLHDGGLHSAKIIPLELASEDYNVEMEEDQINGGKDQEKSMLKVPSNGSDGEDSENPTALTRDEKQGLETGRLFIRNLPYTTNEDELLELFSQFGDVLQVHLIVDKDTKRSKGIGYVLFKLPECALRALEELDNSIFQGRLLHVMPAKPQKIDTPNLETDVGQDKHNFKRRREDQRKASEASGDTRAWNSLFMRQDTVVENIARKHGISKTDLLDREADDLAVRIALGETQVIADTKKSLSSAGVNIAALEKFTSSKKDNNKRSNHVILVKNLPYGSSEGDLAELFGKFGSLEKIILPPTKAMALIIFLEAAEARAAFRGLAYKRYKDAPLYLEWAPDDILSPGQKFEQDKLNNTAVPEQATKSVLVEQTLGGRLDDDDIDPDRVESRTLFVKNLNFKTTDELLKKHFSDLIKTGSIKSVKVQKHIKNGKNLSMGFGFIELDSVETTSNVCKDLQGTILDGHALHLQVCHAKKADRVQKKTDKDLSSTKLIVRNVAFEATEKELRQLFSPFGQIKSLRLPMKFGGHRGFAFVEFVTKQEAQNALQSLTSTHFYGRHLVLEQAKEGESLEELRARTAAQFVDEHNGFQKLSKKRKLTEHSG